MTSYVVDWLPEVLSDLSAIWLRAHDRKAVTAAEAKIDHLLSHDPLGQGTHISEGLNRLDVPPLIVTYIVDTTQNRVEVTSVRYDP